MQAVFEMPDDAIAQLQPMILEDMVNNGVQRKDFAVLNMVADLPANRSPVVKKPHAFRNHLGLAPDVVLKQVPALVGFADIVGRRRDDQLDALAVELAHEIQIIFAGHADLRVGTQSDKPGCPVH